MKKSTRKLALASETIRRLDRIELTRIQGGAVAWSDSECKTTYTWICTAFACGTAVA